MVVNLLKKTLNRRIIFSIVFVAIFALSASHLIQESVFALVTRGEVKIGELFCGKTIVQFDNVTDGTENNDRLIGTAGNDLIRGFSGNDRISGKDGDDCLLGGDGNDIILGGKGNDTIDGGTGSDRCRDSAGTNTIINCE